MERGLVLNLFREFHRAQIPRCPGPRASAEFRHLSPLEDDGDDDDEDDESADADRDVASHDGSPVDDDEVSNRLDTLAFQKPRRNRQKKGPEHRCPGPSSFGLAPGLRPPRLPPRRS